METGTIEQALPGLEQVPLEPAVKPGHALPLTPKKRLMVFAGRSHPELAERIAERLGVELGEIELNTFPNDETYCPLLRVDPRRRRLPRADGEPAGRPAPDRAAVHDPGGEARLREAHHRGDPVVPVLPAGPQGEAAGADLGPPRRGHAAARRRRPRAHDGPPRGPDPGVLHDPGRPHDRAAALRPALPGPRPPRRRCRVRRSGRGSCQGRRSLRGDARRRLRGHAQDAARGGAGRP